MNSYKGSPYDSMSIGALCLRVLAFFRVVCRCGVHSWGLGFDGAKVSALLNVLSRF